MAVSLGSGGTSRVVAIEHRWTKQRYAAKKVPMEDHSLATNEIAILSELDHPAIVRLSDAASIPGGRGIVLVLEHLAGGSLFHYVRRRETLAEAEVKSLMRTMLSAINHLHTRNIAHRDIKLENWAFRDVGHEQLVLIDFGFAKRKSSRRPFTSRVGTAQYMAPEVLEGKYDLSCDMWSLGVAAHYMLVGTGLYDHAHDARELQLLVTSWAPVDMLTNDWDPVGESCKAFVAGLLEKDAACRLTCARAMEHDWITSASTTKPKPKPSAMADLIADLATFSARPRLQQLAFLKLAAIAPSAVRKTVAERMVALGCEVDGFISAEDLLCAAANENRDGTMARKVCEELASLDAIGVSMGNLSFNDVIMISLGAKTEPPSNALLARAFKCLNAGCEHVPLSAERLHHSLGGSISIEVAIRAIAEARGTPESGALGGTISFGEFVPPFARNSQAAMDNGRDDTRLLESAQGSRAIAVS